MHSTLAATFLSLSVAVSATPFSFPLSNGFPNPSPAALAQIQKQAGGTLPNMPLPKSLKAAGVTDFQIIATNEIFETAFFTSLYNNITNNVPGYTCTEYNKTFIEETIFAIRAQEELHSLGANAILKSAGHPIVQPCKYNFPATNFEEAIVLANTFTDLVLGTLQGAQKDFALDGGAEASAVVPLVGSIIGQEGQQDGVFRFLQQKTASSSPFLTSSAGPFAYNAVVQMFIVPGSCPSAKDIAVPTFQPLKPLAMPPAANSTVTYETPSAVTTADYITYISGQNFPVVVPVSNIKKAGSMYQFTAEFPFAGGFSKGLTIAALTKNKGPFANAAAVAAATLAGPGLIEVQ